MTDAGVVFVPQAEAKAVIVTDKMVYVHTDIEEVTPAVSGHPYKTWKCHEYWFTKDEYLHKIAEQSQELGGILNALLGV